MRPAQLVLQFRGQTIEDLDEVLEVEDALFAMLTADEELDGHDIGAAARNIHVLTPDAPATLARLLPFLERAGLVDGLVAATRADDGDAYAVLWPAGHRDPFART